MFVRNKTNVDFTYRKGSYCAILKANSVSFVDENKVTAKEIKNCYGQRVTVISQDSTQYTEEIKKLPPVEKNIKEVTVEKAKLNNSFIEELLGEVNEEIAKGAKEIATETEDATEEVVETEDATEEVVETEATTGIEEVDNFLNGETDELPEGTEVISEEEAKALETAVETEVKKTTNTRGRKSKNK